MNDRGLTDDIMQRACAMILPFLPVIFVILRCVVTFYEDVKKQFEIR